MKVKHTLVIALVFLFMATPASSGGASSNKTIAVCRIEYTALGKSANWRLNYMYAVRTDNKGTVEKVMNIRNEPKPAFIAEDKMIDCIKT